MASLPALQPGILTVDIWGQTILCCVGLSCALQDAQQYPGLYPLDLDAKSTISPGCDNQKHLWTLLDAPWGTRLPPVENCGARSFQLLPGLQVSVGQSLRTRLAGGRH